MAGCRCERLWGTVGCQGRSCGPLCLPASLIPSPPFPGTSLTPLFLPSGGFSGSLCPRVACVFLLAASVTNSCRPRALKTMQTYPLRVLEVSGLTRVSLAETRAWAVLLQEGGSRGESIPRRRLQGGGDLSPEGGWVGGGKGSAPRRRLRQVGRIHSQKEGEGGSVPRRRLQGRGMGIRPHKEAGGHPSPEGGPGLGICPQKEAQGEGGSAPRSRRGSGVESIPRSPRRRSWGSPGGGGSAPRRRPQEGIRLLPLPASGAPACCGSWPSSPSSICRVPHLTFASKVTSPPDPQLSLFHTEHSHDDMGPVGMIWDCPHTSGSFKSVTSSVSQPF